ncbi:MAG: hypothetical protein KatS3mg129_1250 [Leptospiraceae bacterium]|nr:MAG: hypothetical protein KatS3mg129_1250 [Leptospiraceae bacterium]
MDLEKECQQKMEEKFYQIEEKKEDGNLQYRTKYLESNKKYIIKSKKEIAEIFNKGEVFFTKDLKIIYKKRFNGKIRFVPCVSKKWGKTHERNRFKRLVREAMWEVIKDLEKKNQLNLYHLDIAILPKNLRIKEKDYKLNHLLPQIYFFLKKQQNKDN